MSSLRFKLLIILTKKNFTKDFWNSINLAINKIIFCSNSFPGRAYKDPETAYFIYSYYIVILSLRVIKWR